MAAWSYRVTYDAPTALELAPEIGANVKCPPPPADYYIHQDRGIGTDADPYDLANDGPIARCIVESANKVYVERNLYAHLSSDFNEKQDEGLELSLLASKQPPTFAIFGKPGIGATTLAKKIEEYLKCVYLSPESVIEYYRKNFMPEALVPGPVKLGEEENPPDSVLLGLIETRMLEPDVLQRGYVLEGIPRFNQDTDTDYAKQLEILEKLNPKPEYIIIPHMQDVDLFRRRSEQKVDVQEKKKYTRSQYTNKKIEPLKPDEEAMVYYSKKKRKHSLDIGTDAEYAGLSSMVYSQSRPDLTATTGPGFFDEDVVAINAIPSEVLLRLVTSEDDTTYNIQNSFERYKQWLPFLQAFVDKCDVRKVLELNAYWAPQIVWKMVLEFLDNYGVTPYGAMPMPNMVPEYLGEDEGEGEGAGEGLSPLLALAKMVHKDTGESESDDESLNFSPSEYEGESARSEYLSEKEKARKKLAKKPKEDLKYLKEQHGKRLGYCKQYCPVTLHELGLVRKGSPKHAAKFHNRLYYFVDETCMQKFFKNPSEYLPKSVNVPPPRICITGSPGCGQEEVGQEIAREFGTPYFNFREKLHEIVRVKLGRDVGPESFHGIKGSGSSLLGLKHSDSDFDIPSTVLLASTSAEGKANKAKADEYDGEDGGGHPQSDTLGAEKMAGIFGCPINSLEPSQPTEKITGKDRTPISSLVESSARYFLENGDQIPDEVLYELLSTFWLEEPFKTEGFIMVGFPNTAQDVEFMVKYNFVPEFVYILDSKAKTMRNRLITKTVDNWHLQHPSAMKMKTLKEDDPHVPKLNRSSPKTKSAILFNYNTVQKLSRRETVTTADPQNPSWNYTDSISTNVSNSLYQYHELYTKGLKLLQRSLDEDGINLKLIHTDFSLQMSKMELKTSLASTLKYRNSLFESTYVMSQYEALLLLEYGIFKLSKFGRWCPVQISKGNTAVNLWNGPGIKKVPVLHRNCIYFIAGEENVDQFRENVWNLVTQSTPTPNMPLYIAVTGPPKSGKSLLAQKLAHRLGLVYISEETMMDEIVKHSFLNKITEEYDLSSSHLASGPQSMLMADEILAYLRAGCAVPPYMVCRVMDLALMAPRAQFHGAVFDNYPLEVSQLQELLERGIVPSVVVNLQMDLSETVRRCERYRFDPAFNYEHLLEESNSLIEHLYEENQVQSAPILNWFRNETQCVLDINANENPTAIYEKVTEHCYDIMNKQQKYILNHTLGKPTTLDGTTPLTSVLHTKFTREFGSFDPVAINEQYELSRVDDYKDLTKVVEYRDEIYVFSSHAHVEMFMKNPEKYTVPTCEYVPPESVPTPCVLTPNEMAPLENYWGFKDFDAVFYYEGNYQYKWLQRGKPQFCAEYNGKLYFFMNQVNLDKFLKKPYLYTDAPFPDKFPSHPPENALDTVSPAGYVIGTGLSQELCRMLALIGTKRPRFPFMSTSKSALLYLGYYLKTLNMKTPSELRTHYRKAMAHMTNTQVAAENLSSELNKLHGHRTIPAETKEKLQLLIELAEKHDDEKVLDPCIHGLPFSYKNATVGTQSASVPDLDMLREIAGEDGEILDDGHKGLPQPTKKLSNTSLMADYVPPPYLAKNRLW